MTLEEAIKLVDHAFVEALQMIFVLGFVLCIAGVIWHSCDPERPDARWAFLMILCLVCLGISSGL